MRTTLESEIDLREMSVLPRRLVVTLLVPLILLIIGTLGYRLIEGPTWSWLDALYMSVITLTTIGYGETHELSSKGRVFTIFYVLGGVFTIFYVAAELIRSVVSGEVRDILGRRRMERSLATIKDHFIVCGYGRMGKLVTKDFEEQELPYVVIDQDEGSGREFPTRHGLFVAGNATSDQVLQHAGVARALVTVASSDADNLYITMSARLQNAKLFIVARAEEEAAEEKLRRAGANRVVSPYVIGGSRLAQAVLRPTVVDFLDLATRPDFTALQIEEIRLEPGSKLSGQTVDQVHIAEPALIIVGIQRPEGEMVPAPTGERVLEANSVLIVLGPSDPLERLEQLASGPKQA